MRTLVLLLPLLAACQPPRATSQPDPRLPRTDVAMYDLAVPTGGWTGIAVAPRLVLTVAHADIGDADVVVIDSHATYAEQILGRSTKPFIAGVGEVETDWLLVSTADPVDAVVARIAFDAAPEPGTRVSLVGRTRDAEIAPDAPLRRCSVEGVVVERPLFVPDMTDGFYIRTAPVDYHGFSGGPVLLLDGPDTGTVIGMSCEGYQWVPGPPQTIFVARRIDPSMVVPTIEGKRFVVLGRREPAEPD